MFDFFIKITPEDLNMEFERWGLKSRAKVKDENYLYFDVFKGEERCVNIIYEGVIKQKTSNFYFHLENCSGLN